MTEKDCPECTRAASIQRAHKTFSDKVQEQISREKELLQQLKEEKVAEGGEGEERTTKKQRPNNDTDNGTTSSPSDETKLDKSPNKMIDVRFCEVQNLFWDQQRHSLVKKDSDGRLCDAYESLPVFPNPEDLVLNSDPSMITKIQ